MRAKGSMVKMCPFCVSKSQKWQKIFPTNKIERSCDSPLEINVRDDRKIVDIWLTNEEQQDQAIKESLKPLYQQYKAKKYTVAVFLSSSRDLVEETLALLRYNKKRVAELEVQRERKRRNRAR